MSEGRAYGGGIHDRQPARFAFGPARLAGGNDDAHVARMSGKDKDRDERLAAALRENLRRRKSQARAQKPADKEDDA